MKGYRLILVTHHLDCNTTICIKIFSLFLSSFRETKQPSFYAANKPNSTKKSIDLKKQPTLSPTVKKSNEPIKQPSPTVTKSNLPKKQPSPSVCSSPVLEPRRPNSSARKRTSVNRNRNQTSFEDEHKPKILNPMSPRDTAPAAPERRRSFQKLG